MRLDAIWCLLWFLCVGALLNATELLSSAGGYLTTVSTRPASPRPAPSPAPDSPTEPYHIPYPSKEDLAFADRFVDPLWGLTSPVFFSRDDSGKIVRGLQSVPTGVQGRPVLLVGNHQLLGNALPTTFPKKLRLFEVYCLRRSGFGLADPPISPGERSSAARARSSCVLHRG